MVPMRNRKLWKLSMNVKVGRVAPRAPMLWTLGHVESGARGATRPTVGHYSLMRFEKNWIKVRRKFG